MATAHIIHVFSGFLQYLAGALKCLLAQGHSHKNSRGLIQCGLNPGPLDFKSNTLPLSHAGPIRRKSRKSEYSSFLLSHNDLYPPFTKIYFMLSMINHTTLTLSQTSPGFYVSAVQVF